jgi:hypothetical protein
MDDAIEDKALVSAPVIWMLPPISDSITDSPPSHW